MNDKQTIDAPSHNADLLDDIQDLTGSAVAGIGSTSNVPATVGKEPERMPQQNHAKLAPDISFINGKKEQEGAYYAMIQGHKITRNNTRMRVFLIHSIVDIDTTDANTLRRVIYQRQQSEIKAGESYDGAKVKDIQFSDFNTLEPL